MNFSSWLRMSLLLPPPLLFAGADARGAAIRRLAFW